MLSRTYSALLSKFRRIPDFRQNSGWNSTKPEFQNHEFRDSEIPETLVLGSGIHLAGSVDLQQHPVDDDDEAEDEEDRLRAWVRVRDPNFGIPRPNAPDAIGAHIRNCTIAVLLYTLLDGGVAGCVCVCLCVCV